ncbi:MAG: hypothetical protein LBR27_09775 [Bifidobacteriaceae bacterium]|jgi:hypothetical protein|nr:hypothetical protein [Bifidobacteriaceae bacterium]
MTPEPYLQSSPGAEAGATVDAAQTQAEAEFIPTPERRRNIFVWLATVTAFLGLVGGLTTWPAYWIAMWPPAEPLAGFAIFLGVLGTCIQAGTTVTFKASKQPQIKVSSYLAVYGLGVAIWLTAFMIVVIKSGLMTL